MLKVVLRKCEVYFKKCHHILKMLPYFPCKRIDLCHNIFHNPSIHYKAKFN